MGWGTAEGLQSLASLVLPCMGRRCELGSNVPLLPTQAKRQSEILQVRWPDLYLRFPWPKSTRQERAKVQAEEEEVISRGTRDGEEISYCHPRAEKVKIPAPWLETPQPE